MCGIVGYAGNIETACGKPLEVCLQGLERLEYRGYDSAGVALTAPGMDRVKAGCAFALACMLPCAWTPGAFAGGFININVLFELVNIGTLSAFIIVSAGILWMRKISRNLADL